MNHHPAEHHHTTDGQVEQVVVFPQNQRRRPSSCPRNFTLVKKLPDAGRWKFVKTTARMLHRIHVQPKQCHVATLLNPWRQVRHIDQNVFCDLASIVARVIASLPKNVDLRVHHRDQRRKSFGAQSSKWIVWNLKLFLLCLSLVQHSQWKNGSGNTGLQEHAAIKRWNLCCQSRIRKNFKFKKIQHIESRASSPTWPPFKPRFCYRHSSK